MVDTQKAYDDYAESIGTTASALTDSEKKIAFNNAAMAEANRIVEQMGDEQLTTADKISKLKNTFKDMAADIGRDADGLFSIVVDKIQKMADKVAIAIDFSKTIEFVALRNNNLPGIDIILFDCNPFKYLKTLG